MDDCPKRGAVASDLPEESLVEILARVPVRSLCRSKCVAKGWRGVIEDPFHRKKLPQTLQGFFSMRKDIHGLHIGYTSLLVRSQFDPDYVYGPHIGYTNLRVRSQIDPCLSFLTKLPEFDTLTFLDSCNGLLLFGHIRTSSMGYVVCNPATKQWGAVPSYGPPSRNDPGPMYLAFDQALSAHFHLVQFVWDDDGDINDEEELFASVNVYSSESGQWIHIKSGWHEHNLEGWYNLGRCAVLNGMLHFIIYGNDTVQIAAVDVQGVTRNIIPVPITARMQCWPEPGYVAQSQGCLHYINIAADAQLSIWVLEDHDTQKWVLKHRVSSMELFEKLSPRQSYAGRKDDYSVVAMHPDANVVFIVQNWNQKLISYDMDHKLVSVIQTLEKYRNVVVPYVPCFLESPTLTNKL